mgnify:CR=1 FL=1
MQRGVSWIVIEQNKKEIGAVGFIDEKAAIVTAFYDSLDQDKNGTVSWGEWIFYASTVPSTYAVYNVASKASTDFRVLKRDASFRRMWRRVFFEHATHTWQKAVYATYFSRSIKLATKALARRATRNIVKQYAIRKGMEQAVKNAFR